MTDEQFIQWLDSLNFEAFSQNQKIRFVKFLQEKFKGDRSDSFIQIFAESFCDALKQKLGEEAFTELVKLFIEVGVPRTRK